MKARVLAFGVPVALTLLMILAPLTATSSRAQMGQPLDQLAGDDFDTAFLQQMTMHHAMAVEMAKPAVANATHQEAKDLAQSIIDAQTKEITQMRGWAKDWYELDIPDPVAMMGQSQSMAGMNHSGMGSGMGMPMQGGMPMGQMGNMSAMNDMSMMASLWQLPPQRLEVVFLSQMVPHHQSALDAAKLVPDRAAHQELKDLAKSITESQSAEIDKMNGWLASWYGL